MQLSSYYFQEGPLGGVGGSLEPESRPVFLLSQLTCPAHLNK